MKRTIHRRARLAYFFALLTAAFAPQLDGQTVLSGTYNGTSINDDVITNPSTVATFTGGANFTGVSAVLGSNSGLYWQQTGTLTGKNVVFGSGAYVYINGASNTLTLGSGTTLAGNVSIYSDGSAGTALTNQGTITSTSGSGSLYATNFTNDGSITANAGTLYIGYPSASYVTTNSATGAITSNGSGTTVYLRGPLDNNGVVTAQNSGVLVYDGTNTTANLGNVQLATGGRVQFYGTINNTAATLTAPTGGTFELFGGTIQGGTIAAGALTFTSSGGFLSGATLTGDLTLAANTYVQFTGGAAFSGSNANLGTNSGLYWRQTGTLTGQNLTFANGSYVYLAGVGSTLTLGPGSTASGTVSIYTDGSPGTTLINQGAITHTGGSGSVYAVNFTNDGSVTANAGTLYIGYPSASYVTTNSATGTITSNGSGTTVYLRGPVDNNGVVTAQNSGQIIYDGTTTTANLGNVQLASGGRALFNGTIDNTAATLTAPTGGTYELYAGTILGGTIAAGALTFTGSGGFLDGATLTGDLTLPANTYVQFMGGATFSGSNANFGTNSGLYWRQTGTLTGQNLNFANGSYVYLAGTGSTLTLAPGGVATGTVSIYTDGSPGTALTNQGTITHTSGSGSVYAQNFTNDGSVTANAGTLYVGYPNASYVTTNSATGTITSNGSGTILYLRGPVDNNGVVTAQNSGQILYDGTNTTANLGNVQIATGGRVLFNGTIDNTAATLTAPTGGSYELYAGTILGGTIAAGALAFTPSGGYLSGASLADNLTLPASTYVQFMAGANFTGANGTLGANAGLYWRQAGTLTGKTLSFASGSYVYLAGVGSTLTLAPGTTATGDISFYTDGSAGTAFTNQGNITHTLGSGSIYASSATNDGTITASGGTLYIGYPSASYVTTNSATGTITSNGSGTTVYLRGPVDNNGVVTAQNSGVLLYDGANTSANLGNVQIATGGRALFNGTIDNTAATLTAPTGGAFELYGGTIQGGTIAAGALAFTSSGGYLDGATWTGALNVPASTYVQFTGGASFTGASATLGTNAGLYWRQTGTLAGRGLNFGTGAYVYIAGTGSAVTLAPDTTATGSISFYSDGSASTGFTNQGIITHTASTGQIYASNFTNDGSITASSGTLYLGYPSAGYVSNNTATGTITSTGAGTQVVLRGSFTNNGLIQAQSGTIYTSNTLVNGLTGIIKGAGVLNGDVTFAGGTLAPGNSIGNLTQVGGNFTVTGNTTFAVELSGATADQLLFQNPLTIDIGNGLMNLNLTLLGAPVPTGVYNLMQITSGPGTITGTFAGLPNSGDYLVANYLGTDYSFYVTYLSNKITLSVPEPETYALMSLGLALLALRRRRARHDVR